MPVKTDRRCVQPGATRQTFGAASARARAKRRRCVFATSALGAVLLAQPCTMPPPELVHASRQLSASTESGSLGQSPASRRMAGVVRVPDAVVSLCLFSRRSSDVSYTTAQVPA
jgi:hypothetical protein